MDLKLVVWKVFSQLLTQSDLEIIDCLTNVEKIPYRVGKLGSQFYIAIPFSDSFIIFLDVSQFYSF